MKSRNKYEESELLNKLNFKYRDIRKQLEIANREHNKLFIRLNNLDSDEKFTIHDIKALQTRYEDQIKLCSNLDIQEKVWHDCREMLLDVIDSERMK